MQAKWAFVLVCTLWHIAPSFAAPSEHPLFCSAITGPNESCVSQLETYLTTPVPGYTHAWSASAGGTPSTLTGPSTLINWTAPGAQWVALVTTDPGGGSTVCTLFVTVHPQPTPAIFSDFISDCPDRKGNEHSNGDGKPECWVVCENMTINYQTPNVPGNTYEWIIIGGSTTDTGSSVNVTWGTPGSGTVILTETSPGGCSVTVEQCVTIVESPNAWFSFNGQDPSSALIICLGQVVYFNDQSTGGAYWYWEFGDGNTSTLQNPSHTYANPGTYYGTLTVKNECGCTDEVPFVVKVTDKLSPVIGCISTVCLRDCAFYSVSNVCPDASVVWAIHGGQPTTPPLAGSINVIWDDSDGFIAANGYGEICVTVSGCPDLCDGEVCVRVPVIHPVTISGETVVCVGDPVTYTVPVQPGINEIGGTPNGVNFEWSVSGAGTIISTPPYSNTITVVWNSQGTHTVSLEGYENYLTNSDCKFDAASLTVTVKPTFNITPQEAKICLGDSEIFYAFPTDTYEWTVTGPGGVTGPTTVTGPFTVTPGAAGVYAVSAQSNTGTYCNVTPTAVLQVFEAPAMPTGTLIGETTVCLNTPYMYTFSATPPPGTILVWDIVGGILYGGGGQTVTAEWTGGAMSLSVRLRLTEPPLCESAPVSFPITEYTPTLPFIQGPVSACVDEEHDFNITGLSNYTDLQWSVSPPTAGSVVSGHGTPNIEVLFTNTASGTVQVICTATVCGTQITDIFDVPVNQIPSYSIVAQATACQNEVIGLSVTPTTGIASYTWDFGDGSGSGSATPSHSWSATGTYPITVELDLNICGNPTVVAATTIQIDPVPVAYVTASNGFGICLPNVPSTTLTVATQIFCTYAWSTGATGPTLLVTTPGTYTVTATDPVTGCEAVITRVVDTCGTICPTNATPWDFTFSENCDTYTFVPVPSGSSNFIGWSFGDFTGSASTGTQVHTYDHPGFYQATIFSYDPIGQCTLISVHTVTVKFKGNFAVNYNCSTGSMISTLTDISEYLPGFPASSPQWFDGGSIGTGSPLNIGLTPGSHNIYLQVVVSGQTCVSPTQNITVPGLPLAAFGHDAPACEGMPVTFTNGSSGGGLTGYDWDFGDFTGSGLENPQRSYEYDATLSPYTVTLTIGSEWGCTSSATATVTIHPRGPDPLITIAPATPVCEGTPVVLTATGGLLGYTWFNSTDPGAPLQGPAPLNTYTATASGLYGVSATDANGCQYNVLAPDAVVIYPPPYVQITGKTDYCRNEPMYFSADIGSGFSYYWVVATPGGGTSTSTASFVIPNSYYTGTFTLSVTITDNVSGCTNSGTVTAEVHPGPSGLSISASAACAPATLTASASGAVQYNWSTGTVGTSTSVLQGGFYSVVASDAWGCTTNADYFLNDLPDLSNVMTGCYEFCNKVEWQAPNCPGCMYQWTMNGAPIPGETNPTITITNSGVYTVIVSNGPGCTAESDPIDISIALTPDLCHKCRVDIREFRFKCIGTDPLTGQPLYEFWIDVINTGGALYGLNAVSGLGTVTMIDPASGFLPGGGALTTLHGYLVWNGGSMEGCITFLGYLSKDCKTEEECKFEWCGELPKCCEDKCDIRVREAKVECVTKGFYRVTLAIDNNGCELTNLYIKTPYGIYPLSPSTLPTGGTTWVTAIIAGNPGSMGVAICGIMPNGKECCTEIKLQMPECHHTECEVAVQRNFITCTGFTPEGFPIYQFGITVYGVPGGSIIYVLPNQTGLVTGVTYSCLGAVCTVQGTFTDYSHSAAICFTILTVNWSTEPPKVCIGKVCFHAPDCREPSKPASEREDEPADKMADKQPEFFLAPNPATTEVRITGMESPAETIEVYVTDMLGKHSLYGRVAGNNPVLDISALPAGVYIVTLRDNKGAPVSRKLTVLR